MTKFTCVVLAETPSDVKALRKEFNGLKVVEEDGILYASLTVELPKSSDKNPAVAVVSNIFEELRMQERIEAALDELGYPYVILDDCESDPAVSTASLRDALGKKDLLKNIFRVQNLVKNMRSCQINMEDLSAIEIVAQYAKLMLRKD